MVKALGDLDTLPFFDGQASHTYCFAHIVNLVAKSLLRQFDPPKCKANNNDSPDDDLEHALHELVEGLEIEEMDAHLNNIETNGNVEKDDDKELVDLTTVLSEGDWLKWQTDIKPIQMALAKA